MEKWRYGSTYKLGTDGGEWSESCHSLLTHRKRFPCTHCLVGCVGLIASLDAVTKRKISYPFWEWNP